VIVLRRKKGVTDPLQIRTYAAYDELIIKALRERPWSTVPEITRRVNELKRRLSGGRLPAGKLQPRIVRKHLNRLHEKKVVLIYNKQNLNSRQYALFESLAGPSYPLHKKVRSALQHGRIEELDFMFASNVAECTVITTPESSRGRRAVAELAELEAARLGEGLFGLETLVTYGMKCGYISPEILSQSRIDWTALLAGLRRTFEDLNLFVFSFAVDVEQLLNYLSTRPGMKLASRILAKRWDTIVEKSDDRYKSARQMIINRMDTTGYPAIFARLADPATLDELRQGFKRWKAAQPKSPPNRDSNQTNSTQAN
jgi:hypothetical protein